MKTIKLSATFIRVLAVVVTALTLIAVAAPIHISSAQAQGESNVSYQPCSLPAIALRLAGALLNDQPHTAKSLLGAFRELSSQLLPPIENVDPALSPLFAKPQPTGLIALQKLVNAAAVALHACDSALTANQ